MKNDNLVENETFIENLLEGKTFDSKRKQEFKNKLYNYITALSSNNNSNSNFFSSIFFRARFVLIGAFSFILILIGIAVLPSLNSISKSNPTNGTQQSQSSSDAV